MGREGVGRVWAPGLLGDVVELYGGRKTIRVNLKYGTDDLPLEFEETPGFEGVLEASALDGLRDPLFSLGNSLSNPIESQPLSDLACGRKSACIVISDSTRPMSTALILRPILDVLDTAGIPRKAVTVLIATGMHRGSTPEEKMSLVGPRVAEQYTVRDHEAGKEETLTEVGLVAGEVPVLVNKLYMEADLKILTGFIEPHMWAGFSGGRKAILPGISGLETLKFMHGPAMIAHPSCEYGILEGNPFHEAGIAIMERAGADFIVNVTLNKKRENTGVFSGHPVKAHLAGCGFLSQYCVREVAAPLDFAVTTNAGAPLDCNLYQTVKGITGAAGVVKEGGDVVIASRCAEGAGNPEYRKILAMVDSPESFLKRLMAGEFFLPDQWCSQEMYQVVTKKDVWVHTEGISDADLRRYHLHPAPSIEACIDHLLGKHGRNARWAIVPDGPMVVLRLS